MSLKRIKINTIKNLDIKLNKLHLIFELQNIKYTSLPNSWRQTVT